VRKLQREESVNLGRQVAITFGMTFGSRNAKVKQIISGFVRRPDPTCSRQAANGNNQEEIGGVAKLSPPGGPPPQAEI
jgi:hypothetical protein